MINTTKSSNENNKRHEFNCEEHLLRLVYFDGFSERLLGIELWVDLALNYELSYSTFQTETITLKGTLARDIAFEFETLIELDLALLDEVYDIHDGAAGFSFYSLDLNQYGEIWKFDLGKIPTRSECRTEEEEKFFKFLLMIKNFLINETGHDLN